MKCQDGFLTSCRLLGALLLGLLLLLRARLLRAWLLRELTAHASAAEHRQQLVEGAVGLRSLICYSC